MRRFAPPFKFDLEALLSGAKRRLITRVGGVSINLPFVSFEVEPDDVEQKLAREIVIRMADRRVLNTYECCDQCIEQALASLQEIRSMLVEKQVELAKATDGPLYLLTELMLEAIRQFLTFEQRLGSSDPHGPDTVLGGRRLHSHEQYFAALEMLRAHLYRCLLQVSKISKLEIPRISDHMRYDDAWQEASYHEPRLEDGS